ncbi:MAG: Gfo/Idh/MocA family protein [Blastocatellia bacterium]
MSAGLNRRQPRVLVVGCGSIGQRHIRNLRALGVSQITAYDAAQSQLDKAAKELQVLPAQSLETGLQTEPDLVLVCTPPHLHVPIALQAVAVGCHVFIEKPLADKIDGVDQLLSEAAGHDRIVYVGYMLRLQQGIRRLKQLLDDDVIGRVMSIRAEVGQYLPDWRPTQDYRNSYTANSAMGGGIILDGSHELDYVTWLGGEAEAVFCSAGRLSALCMDVEDTAEIVLKLKGNVLAQIHLDCIQRGYSRSSKWIGEKGTLIWDYSRGIRRYDADSNQWNEESISPDPNAMYIDEMRHVLACLSGEEQPHVTALQAKRVLEVALAAKKSAVMGSEVRLPALGSC